ncbi:MAG: MarR family transcriptional regulator [Candidatus Marinimicrobia bacterium]|nr:MarR family transcriptional regulator [Candidatus Neomarinimicrobiota bacterium]
MRVTEVIRDLACHLQAFIRTLAGERNLSPTQAQVLFTVTADGISMSDLARRLGLDPSTMSRIVAMMVSKGWLEQTPSADDRRVTLVALSADGADLHGQLEHDLQLRLDDALGDMDSDDLENLKRPLEDLAWRLIKARG